MPRVLGGSEGGGRFLMGEVPLYADACEARTCLQSVQALSRRPCADTASAGEHTGVPRS